MKNNLIKNVALHPATSAAPTAPAFFCWEICKINWYTAKDCQMILVEGSIWDILNYVDNNLRGNLYSYTYNPGWRYHPKFSYKNDNPQLATKPWVFQKLWLFAPLKSNLGLLMENVLMTQTHRHNEFRNKNLHTNEVLGELTTKVENIYIHNKLLETQIYQVVKQQASSFISPRTSLRHP